MDEPSKRCCTCGTTRPLSDFNVRRAAPDGLQSHCRACSQRWYEDHRDTHQANVRRRNERVRREVFGRLAAYFAEHPCIDCGERDVRCLEFDHRDSATKVAEVGNLLRAGTSWSRVLAEIEKCDVRCANCHRRVTSERGAWWRQAVYEQARDEQVLASHARLECIFSTSFWHQPGEAP